MCSYDSTGPLICVPIILQDPATGYLSDSDVIGRVWSDTIQDNRRSLAGSCSCSVASRGIILSSRGTSPKWRPLYKPKWNEVYRQVRYHRNSVVRIGIIGYLVYSMSRTLLLRAKFSVD